MTLKEKVENNVAIWLLGMLLAGFLAGMGVYKSILEIANLEVVAKTELASLRSALKKQVEVESTLTKETSVTPEKESILTKTVKLHYKCWNTSNHVYVDEIREFSIPDIKVENEVAVSTHEGRWACVVNLFPAGNYQARIYSHDGKKEGAGNIADLGKSTVNYLTYRMQVEKLP